MSRIVIIKRRHVVALCGKNVDCIAISKQGRYFPDVIKAVGAVNVDLHRGLHWLHDCDRAACERAGNQRLRGADGVCTDAASSRSMCRNCCARSRAKDCLSNRKRAVGDEETVNVVPEIDPTKYVSLLV